MLEQINYRCLDEKTKNETFGKGLEFSAALVTTFAVVAIVTVVLYKVFGAKTGDITLPGGFKFKFTT